MNADSALWELSEATAGLTGQSLMDTLVERLGALLGFGVVTIGRREGAPPDHFAQIASWSSPQIYWDRAAKRLEGTPCEQTLAGRVVHVPHGLHDRFPAELPTAAESYVGIPLFDMNGAVIGHLGIYDTAALEEDDPRLALIRIFALRAEAELRRMRMEQDLRRLATTDPLTGLANRRTFFEAMEREIERARRYALPLALLMLDLDHFKRVNDVHGHATGDDVLRALVVAVSAAIRHADVFGRLGGEEFAVLAPHTDREGAIAAADRIHKAVREMEVPHESGPIRITVSIGASVLDHVDLTAEDLLRRADSGLYSAKRQGRNQTVYCTPFDGEAEGEACCPPAPAQSMLDPPRIIPFDMAD